MPDIDESKIRKQEEEYMFGKGRIPELWKAYRLKIFTMRLYWILIVLLILGTLIGLLHYFLPNF